MNSRERVLTAFQFKEPDRVPLFEAWIDREIMEAVGNGSPYKTRDRLGIDCLPIAIGYPESTNAWRTGADEWGRIFKNGLYADGLVKSLDDADRYTPPLEYAGAWFPNEIITKVKNKYGDSHALYYAFHDGCLGLSYMSMGLENFFLSIYRDRDLVEYLMKRSTDWTIAMIERAGEAGVDFIVFGDDVAHRTGPMLPPKLFRELVLPSYKKIVAASRVPLIWHSDGLIEPLLPMIIEAGFAGVHSLEPNAGIDMAHIKKQYGNRLVLMGNLDVSNVLSQSNLDVVRRDVERCIEQGASGGGYLFSSSNSLFKGMPVESILEAYRYAREIGVYQ